MTAALQTYARATQIAIDTLKFKTNVREFDHDKAEQMPEPDYGVNIHGTYI